MTSFNLKIFVIFSTVFASNNKERDQILTKFIEAFNNENNIQNWLEARNKVKLYGQDLFKELTFKIRDVLAKIINETDNYLKSLIIHTNMDKLAIGHRYIEAFIMISSLKRIIRINLKHNASSDESLKNLNYFLKVLNNEYEQIYYDLSSILMVVGIRYNTMETFKLQPNWQYSNENECSVDKIIQCNTDITANIIKKSNEMIDSIFPEKDSKTVYCEANYMGFLGSKKCLKDEINCFILEKSSKICPGNVLGFPLKCSTAQSIFNEIDLKYYLDKGLLCNHTTAKLLITLFHFYSEIRECNTKYNIVLQANDLYLINWSLSNTQSKEEIKARWLQKKIFGFASRKIFHKFGLIVDYYTEYSTIKPEDTNDKPKNTKLILMSCGHQLGLELIDEFLEYYHSRNTTPLKCHICRIPIWIVGSYDTVVYKCK